VTVLEIIQRGTEFLGKRGVDSPRLQSELLVAHFLNMPRMKLYLDFERVLTSVEVDGLRSLVQRRGLRQPLQHITGSACFCGLEIAVNQKVLIPRPETELLAELGWEFLNQSSGANEPVDLAASPAETVPPADRAPGPSALDFGTGSGCLAIAIATHSPSALIHAVDISSEALEVAAKNAARHRVSERIQFAHGDGFAALGSRTEFDLIVSNPPYIPTAEIETLQPEVRDHDPREALDGGGDGLNFYRRLSMEARPFLKANGIMMLEFGDGQAQQVGAILEKQNWVVERVVADYTQHPRILIVRAADRIADGP
jgi:release factor glutamine methyltransferase